MKRIGELVANREVYSVPLESSVFDAVSYMAARHVGAVCVLEGGQLAGIFSERDVMKRIVVAGRDPRNTPLADVVSRELVTATADDSPAACLERMRKIGIRHLPVFSDGKLLGLVTMRDLMLADLAEKHEEVASMRNIITST